MKPRVGFLADCAHFLLGPDSRLRLHAGWVLPDRVRSRSYTRRRFLGAYRWGYRVVRFFCPTHPARGSSCNNSSCCRSRWRSFMIPRRRRADAGLSTRPGCVQRFVFAARRDHALVEAVTVVALLCCGVVMKPALVAAPMRAHGRAGGHPECRGRGSIAHSAIEMAPGYGTSSSSLARPG